MLEGSFRPSSSATALPQYGFAKSGFNDQSSAVNNMRRKDPPGSSFAPVHDRRLPEYESEDHQQLPSPPGPRYFKTAQQSHSSAASSNLSPHSHTAQVGVHPSPNDGVQPSAMSKHQESVPKNSSIGPMRAKKKPAGSACNSCHRLKTRCSGGHPCDRCAAHKVPCQFDRDLIYRSPLASSSQQASVRNAHAMNKAESGHSKSRARGGAKTGRKASTASAAPTSAAPVTGMSQPSSTAPVPPISLPQVVRLSPPPIPATSSSAIHQPTPLQPMTSKPAYRSTPVSTPALSETYVGYEPNLPHPNALHLRLAALESSVSGLLQVLRAQQSANSGLFVSGPDRRPPLSPPTPPTLVMSGSSSTFGPEKDLPGDHYRLGNQNNSCPIGDPLSKSILSPTQLQYLYDVFVEFCLPNLPILHGVQIALIRARSPFLFTVMVTIGARFCSSQSAAHIPPNSSLRSNSTGGKIDLSQMLIDEQTYARLVALSHLHLSATLLKATHSLEDVRAILFLACWALVSNEDPNGTPNRWVLIGHAGRIGRSIGLDRCANELLGCKAIWNNPEIHETRREQLDAIKTDEALRAIETILSSNLKLEPSRNYFPPLHMPAERESNFSIVKLSTGSPHQYDIVSAAQIEALAELAEIWAAVNSFLTVAEDRNRSVSGEQFIELGERHNQAMDAWAKKWTWQGSSWAPLLGVNLRTIRLLSESLRITLNLAFTNVLYAITSRGKPTHPKFQEALGMALERVSGSSTAVIQAHRDSVREGFSLAFAPDMVTDGLVSAAITVLQLASPIGLTPMLGKSGAKEASKGAPRHSVPSSNVAALVNEDRPLTPHSGEDTGDIETHEANAPTTNMVYFHQTNPHKDPARDSRGSSPSSTPSRFSKSSSPRGNATGSLLPDTTANGNQAIGKKCFMEPPVAAHYIRMATDVLQASDRSQTRLGTIMASKIMKLAAHAGLMNPSNASASKMTSINNTANFNPDTVVAREDRPSISSTSSLASAKNGEVSNGEKLRRNPHHKITIHRCDDNPNLSAEFRQEEDEDDLIDDRPQGTPQATHHSTPQATNHGTPQATHHADAQTLDAPETSEDGPGDPKEEADELGNDDSRGYAHYSEENQSSFSIEKKPSDMMEEDE